MLTKLSALVLSGAVVLACGDSGDKPITTPDKPAAELVFPPKVDQPAPGGSLQDGQGNSVDLAGAWGGGRAVIVFYRGNW